MQVENHSDTAYRKRLATLSVAEWSLVIGYYSATSQIHRWNSASPGLSKSTVFDITELAIVRLFHESLQLRLSVAI
jgi:hypothetical protein